MMQPSLLVKQGVIPIERTNKLHSALLQYKFDHMLEDILVATFETKFLPTVVK